MKPTHLTWLLCPLPFCFCAFEPSCGGTNAAVEMLEGQRGQKNKLHLESDCLGWKLWAVRLGVQLKNQNCSRSKNLNCYKIIKLARLWELLIPKELRERQARSRHTQCIPGTAAVPWGGAVLVPAPDVTLLWGFRCLCGPDASLSFLCASHRNHVNHFMLMIIFL